MLTTLAYGQTMEKRDFLGKIGPEQGLLQQASLAAGSARHIADDLVAGLFPKSTVDLSDRILSFSRQFLHSVIAEIETEVCRKATDDFGVRHETIADIGSSDRCHVFALLQKSGLLNSREIMEHVFAQAQRAELTARLLEKISQQDLETALTRHLDHADAGIADAAMALLIAQSKEGADSDPDQARISSLPAEIFHALAWPVTAAIRKLSGYAGQGLVDATQQLLQEFDEGQSAQNRAQKLAQMIEIHPDLSADVPHPLKDGLALFIARLAHKTNLSSSQIVLFTAEPSMARMVTVLKALNFSADSAISIQASLDGNGQILTAATYNEIDPELARGLVLNWASSAAYQEAEQRLDAHDMGRTD